MAVGPPGPAKRINYARACVCVCVCVCVLLSLMRHHNHVVRHHNHVARHHNHAVRHHNHVLRCHNHVFKWVGWRGIPSLLSAEAGLLGLREFACELTSSWPPARVKVGSQQRCLAQFRGIRGKVRIKSLCSRLCENYLFLRSKQALTPPPEPPQSVA